MQLSKPWTSSPRATWNKKVDSTELLQAVVLGDEPEFDPFTGADPEAGGIRERSYNAKAGLETPRFCQLCGRRMVVQVHSDSWTTEYSRHGEVNSVMSGQR